MTDETITQIICRKEDPETEAAVEKIALAILDKTKEKFDHAIKELVHQFYDETALFLDEHLANVKQRIGNDMTSSIINNYKQSVYDGKRIRALILREHRKEIIDELNQDITEENIQLKKDLQQAREEWI